MLHRSLPAIIIHATVPEGSHVGNVRWPESSELNMNLRIILSLHGLAYPAHIAQTRLSSAAHAFAFAESQVHSVFRLRSF